MLGKVPTQKKLLLTVIWLGAIGLDITWIVIEVQDDFPHKFSQYA